MSEDLKMLHIPSKLHKRVKLKTAKEGITIRHAAEKSLTAYVEGKI
jgi:predicted HicB family RNase H-like nuclease